MSALDIQIGGRHYKSLPYQPVELACKVHLNFIQGNMLKYLCRYKSKNGKEDLLKVVHYAKLGKDLQPKNFFDDFFKPEDSEEVERFLSLNSLQQISEVLAAVCMQQWDDVISGTEKLISDL